MRRLHGWLMIGAAFAMVACGKDATGPVAGSLSVKLTSPNSGQDSAIVLTVSGPAGLTSAVSGPGLRMFTQPLGTATNFALVGQLNTGAVIITIGVPDVNKVNQYSATIEAVAQPNYQLRASLSGYTLSVTK